VPRVIALMLVAVLALAGCGKSSSSDNGASGGNSQTPAQTAPDKTHFAKTKFVLHAGLAFGAFHRYIYKPYKAGKLGGGLLKNKKVKIKAALAAAFAYHEVKIALKDARSSRILRAALAPLLALQTKLSSMKSGLKRGQTSQVEGASGDVNSISAAGKAAGQPIADQPTPSLGG
jgi:hypothetical protein